LQQHEIICAKFTVASEIEHDEAPPLKRRGRKAPSVEADVELTVALPWALGDEIAETVDEVAAGQKVEAVVVIAADERPDAGRVGRTNDIEFGAEGLEHQAVERKSLNATV
jgi:hypothetical protein